jgi:hypothetical protein
MPGVKVVEEPTADLWFPPDQCVVPEEAAEDLAEVGYLGLGDFYDPEPWMPADPAYAQLIEWARTMPYPSPEREAELEQQLLDDMLAEWRESLPAMFRDAPVHVVDDILNKVFYLSVNSKTGFSFNIRIAGYRGFFEGQKQHPTVPGTCSPTEWCMAHCYAKTGHFTTWDRQHWYDLSRQQARYLQNLIVSHLYERAPEEEVEEQADLIYEAIRSRFYTQRGKRSKSFPEDAPINLRWNGGGDFNPGTIRIVNAITRRHPDMVVWGFTRKSTTAGLRQGQGLVPSPNLVMNVSLDPTTPHGRSGGKRGFKLQELAEAAARMNGNLVYATHIVEDPRVVEIRDFLHEKYGDLNVTTVFGYHCSALHTTIGDPWECSATNKRVYASCQECRWCMMSHAQRAAEGVSTPNQAYFSHGYEPDYEEIDKENEAIERWNKRHPDELRPLIEPMTEEEAWG